jgi:hypothetical protein
MQFRKKTHMRNMIRDLITITLKFIQCFITRGNEALFFLLKH